MYCLQFIPTSLAQTIRATNPACALDRVFFAAPVATRDDVDRSIVTEVWVVAITGVLGQRYGLPTMCSLIPLVGGADAVSLDTRRVENELKASHWPWALSQMASRDHRQEDVKLPLTDGLHSVNLVVDGLHDASYQGVLAALVSANAQV